MVDSHQKFLHTLDIDGHCVPVQVRRNAKARHLILRIDDATGGAVVTIPKRTAVRDGVDLAKRKSAWIAAQLERRVVPMPFVDGMEFPFKGVTHVIHHDEMARTTQCCAGVLNVSGRPEHLKRRVVDWLKAQARMEFSERAHEKAERIGCRVKKICVRDTRSRWGSCGVKGHLNFSWRLVMAPPFVLDYVVAHEVAHLHHRNHGADFWALTQTLCDQMGEAKSWLRVQGRTLHRYGG